MTRHLIKTFCVLSLSLAPMASFAADTSKGVETRGTSSNTGPSVKDNADKSKGSNSSGQAMSFLQGAMHIGIGTMLLSSACAPPTVTYGCIMGPIQIGMGLLSLAQGKEHGSSASGAGVTGFQTDGLGYTPGNVDPYDLNDPNNPLNKDPQFKAVTSNLKKLESSGIYNPKNGTIKTPDGKTYKVSDFASTGAMSAAGLPQGAIDSAMDYAKKLSKKAEEKAIKLGALTTASGFDEGGGSGGSGMGSGPSSEDGSSSSLASAGSGLGKVGLDRDPSSLAGMQKNYNGEPIGVAADSIFLMMTRRYKVKESQESFFTDAELALQK
ncbi:hypothetical protein [Bdellovibrio sp.]|uniref:hypothetical protein n=1 Tax=Bdellovibrio sp. TaxID=28201 RepID=UPI0039E21640